MNLWIRSQDKKELRPNPNLGIERNYYIVDRYSFDKEIILAKYATEERALEVLDEIQKTIERCVLVQKTTEWSTWYKGTVYEMPEE